MKIGIIGATGKAGQAIYREAEKRNHDVTAIVRSSEKARELFGDNVKMIKKDVFTLNQADLSGFDYIVDAFASPKAYEHLDLAGKLIRMFRENEETTLFFILGAASLNDDNGKRYLDTILANYAGQPWIATPLQQAHEYDYLQWIDNVKWTAISPQETFNVGPATGYVMGEESIMKNSEGKSTVTTGNVAKAVVDEIESPTHLNKRFTVVDQ